MTMHSSVKCLETADNTVTQNYLQELLTKVNELKTNVAENESKKTAATTELDSIATQLQHIVVTTADLKSKQILASKQQNGAVGKGKAMESTSFAEQFKQLQQILGLAIKCYPEKKSFEIIFGDAQQSRILFSYNNKRIELEEMHPEHPNFNAIRENLRETGDLLGFLAVLNRKLNTI